MARTSGRLSAAAKASVTHKRVASTTAAPDAAVKRSKTATPTKSEYFKSPDDDDDDDDESGDESPKAGDNASAFGSDDEGVQSTSEADEGDDYESEANSKLRKRATPRGSTATGSGISTTNSGTGLGPGKQLIIQKLKPRAAGKIPYTDDSIHPNTFLFLEELEANNDRAWLKMHDADFRQSEKDWHSFVEKLTERLVEIDDTVPELPVKDIIFRIYRDVRFHGGPPYKTHFAAAWSRTGRKGPYAHYYVQIGAGTGGSFVGGGLWHPDAAPTSAMRQSIDGDPRALKDVLRRNDIRTSFLGGASGSDAKVVAAFVKTNGDNALKTKPKGYAGDHADISLLRLRNYTLGKKLASDDLVGKGGLDRVAELLTSLKPFITHPNSVVMPEVAASADGAGEDSSEDDGDDE